MALTAEWLGTAFAPSPARRGAALAGGAIVALAAADGGYAPAAWRGGAVAFAAVAGLLALWAPMRPARSAVLIAGSLAGYAVLSLSSAVWSAHPAASILDTQRTLLYLTALASFVLAGEGLAAGVVLGAAVVGVWALGARALHYAPPDPFEGRLLTGPIGYANGLGVLMAVGAAVCVAESLRSRRPFMAAPLAIFAPALLLTNSRGSLVAVVAGCSVAFALAAGRRIPAALVVIASSALLALLLVVGPREIGDRANYWGAARATIAAHPIGGTGAGTFGLHHVEAPYARDAHSLYLQALSDLGVGGLVLVLGVVAIPLATAIRNNLAVPAAGLTVFAFHAGVDWDWQLPAVTVAGLALAAAATAGKRGRQL